MKVIRVDWAAAEAAVRTRIKRVAAKRRMVGMDTICQGRAAGI
jgi:hypothetical protein